MPNENAIDKALEERMDIAQTVSSMVLALRRKVNIKVRQPLNKIMLPVTEQGFDAKFDLVKNLVLTEVNVKEVEYLFDTTGMLVKTIKPNFKVLGPKYGKIMKGIASAVNAMSQDDIVTLEKEGKFDIDVNNQVVELVPGDVDIFSEDIPGWLVANEGKTTVALDITLTEALKEEGIARELVNRIQNLRKDSGLDVTDKINLYIQKHDAIIKAVDNFSDYIGGQTLANSVELVDQLNGSNAKEFEIEGVSTIIHLEKAL